MQEKFDIFKKPPLESQIWRYMDFTKFVATISKSALYFSRMDLLDDKFEGSIPKAYPLKRSSKKRFYWQLDDRQYRELRNAQKRLDRLLSKVNKANTKLAFINSWHVNGNESIAMWRLYLKNAEGVAIQSTFKRLNDSFIKKGEVSFGQINYVDDYYESFNTEEIYLSHLQFPFMFKRKCFEFEKELRAIILTAPFTEQAKKEYLTKRSIRGTPDGLVVQVDLNTLVEKVYVAPTAEKWFGELVKSVVENYGFNLAVVPSSLADNPTF